MSKFYRGKRLFIKHQGNAGYIRVGTMSIRNKGGQGWRKAIGFELEIWYNGVNNISNIRKL